MKPGDDDPLPRRAKQIARGCAAQLRSSKAALTLSAELLTSVKSAKRGGVAEAIAATPARSGTLWDEEAFTEARGDGAAARSPPPHP